MKSLRSIVLAGLLPFAAGASLEAQAPAPLRVLAFADTASVRVQLTGDVALARARVRATITSVTDGRELWSGPLGQLAAEGGNASLQANIAGLRPRLWSPGSPELYYLAVEVQGRQRLADTVRFGFRRFEAKNGQLLLNGQPLFLRGNAINPPQRMLPDSLDENPRFIADYVRYLKSVGVNIIRLTAPSQNWFDVCDELGMLVFQGHYGTPRGGSGTEPPADFDAALQWYRDDVLGPQINHPSIVVYALSNEQAAEEISYKSRGAAEVEAFLSRAWRELRQYDPTRAYITNAGYGFGRSGEICDIHRYWGWYYNSIFSFYTLRDPQVCWRTPTANQPLTLTENTGNYTAPSGAFNLVSGTKQPESQLNWTGHAPMNEQPARALRYQAWTAQQAIEITRRLRRIDPFLAGLFPFTIVFHDWHGITRFADMRPKPVADAYALAYQPILLSWELWTPQVYAGSTIRPVAHVVNDAENVAPLENAVLEYQLTDAQGRVRLQGRSSVPAVPYYEARALPLTLQLPADLATGEYTLAGRLLRDGAQVSRNFTTLYIEAQPTAKKVTGLARRVRLHDPAGATARAFTSAGIAHEQAVLAKLDTKRDLLVVAPDGWNDALTQAAAALRRFIDAGGRVLLLSPPPGAEQGAWLPAAVEARTEALDHGLYYPGGRPFRQGMAINPERPTHPVFAGIDRDRLFLWSDFTGWTDTVPGFPAAYPVLNGFTLSEREALPRIAILANYDHGLEGVALAELFAGRGSVLLSGFGIIERTGLDPVADRMLNNLVRYMASNEAHHAHPLIDSAITWGDYGSERGVVSEIYHGLLVHTEPQVPAEVAAKYPIERDSLGFVRAGGAGGWNTRPSIEYVARGRRPFGPWDFTLGGSVRALKGTGTTGEGTFSLRLPAARTVMITTVENATDRPLPLETTVNGAVTRSVVPAGTTLRIESPLPGPATEATVRYRGDRRLILVQTDFR